MKKQLVSPLDTLKAREARCWNQREPLHAYEKPLRPSKEGKQHD